MENLKLCPDNELSEVSNLYLKPTLNKKFVDLVPEPLSVPDKK